MGTRRSIGGPLAVGIVLMLLVLALAVGWQVLVWTDVRPLADRLPTLNWLLIVLGTLFFVLVLAGLVWLSVWLVVEVRLNQRQRAFLDAVTHEMKTPLASFRLGLDTIGRHRLEPLQQTEFVERMQQDLDRLDQTVGQVLAAARAEERKKVVPAELEPISLGNVLEKCIATLSARHDLAEGSIRLEGLPDCAVRADPSELLLAFGNLIENAIKYSEVPIEVRVRVRPVRDGRVDVEISDSGIGIPPGELRKIFRRFYRVGRDVQRQVAGLGLGLFVVRSMLKRQGGRVTAHSAGTGSGSRFVVTLHAVPSRPVSQLHTPEMGNPMGGQSIWPTS